MKTQTQTHRVIGLLQAVLDLYNRMMHVGHTEAMMQGARASERKCGFLAVDQQHALFLMGELNKDVPASEAQERITLTFDELERGCAGSMKLPILLDNYTVERLLTAAVCALKEERTRRLEATRKLGEIAEVLSRD